MKDVREGFFHEKEGYDHPAYSSVPVTKRVYDLKLTFQNCKLDKGIFFRSKQVTPPR